MHKTLNRILLVFAIIFGLLAMGIGLLIAQSGRHENESKRLLTAEITRLPVAPDCAEQGRSYQRGGLDANSSWQVLYDCKTTGGAAYSAITTQLLALGYQARNDSSVPDAASKSISYRFTYQNSEFRAEYDFLPQATAAAGQPEVLQRTLVTGITLHIYRAGRSY